jgi:hypothetical protein
LAVHVTDALPAASVVPVVAESTQLAPEAGAANVTVALFNAVPFEVTFATRGAAKATLTCALWPDPLPAVIFMTGWGVMFEFDEPQLARKPAARNTRAMLKIPVKMPK